ncbi:ATP-binding protein [Bacillus sp. AK128]
MLKNGIVESLPNSLHSLNDEKARNDRLISIGQVSAGIAHEVRNPLTSVKGFLQLLQEEKDSPYLDIAMDELERALSTLNNLLQVSKPDLEAEPYKYISIGTELESILSLFQEQMYRITLVKSINDYQVKIYGQKNALKKAFFNLLKNAFEAMLDQGELRITQFVKDEFIHIIIQDNGTGIPKDKLDLLGTPFFTTKENGTGMGLTQVFTTFHKHGAKVNITSEEGVGTTFNILFPIQNVKEVKIEKMNQLQIREDQSFKEFLYLNQEAFDRILHDRTKNVFLHLKNSSIREQSMFEIAKKIISLIDQDAEHELIELAKNQGITWAKNEVASIIKLEWFQELRSIYWDFMYHYFQNISISIEEFFTFEKKTNHYVDTYLNNFIVNYTDYHNKILQSQREVIEELSVPIIPLTDKIAILPIVGTMDTYRAKRLQEKSLSHIEKERLKKMIIDLSGVAYMDTAVVSHLFKIVEGFALLGCDAVVTGIRSEVANTMIELGVTFSNRIETKADLKQTLEELKII